VLPSAPPARELRKRITVLFCDVAGSTAMGERLDPESTPRVMARYFDVTREAVERHGGSVEKFRDAVMAVIAVPKKPESWPPRDPARARPEGRLRGDRPADGRGDLIEAARIAGEAAELAGDYSSFDGPTGGGRGRSGARP